MILVLLLLLLIAATISPTTAWRQWTSPSSSSSPPINHPGSRRGHSLTAFGSKIVLFGGRGNDLHRPHVPRTYEIQDFDGQLQFASHDGKPLSPNYDPTSCQPEVVCHNVTGGDGGADGVETKGREYCTYSWQKDMDREGAKDHRRKMEEQCGFVPSALFFNDVFVYDVDCTGDGDDDGAEEVLLNHNCPDDERRGWRRLHPGVKLGGCRTVSEDDNAIGESSSSRRSRICDTPSERWGHGAAMLDESTLLIYGGFSHECEDYCDDMWLFDLEGLEWRFQEERTPWRPQSDNGDSIGPGPRWKFSMNGGAINATSGESMVVLFGGHRLWHGYASDNSELNDWMSRELLPEGGYLNDLWIYSKESSSLSSAISENNEIGYRWKRQVGKETCKASPGASWESRNDVKCTVHWPLGRSGHATVVDNSRQGMWLFGGFSTPYPYPTSTSPGAGWGIEEGEGAGFVPSGYPYYLDDLWFYNFTTGNWEEKQPVSLRNPPRRTEPVLALSDSILILYGGYADNRYYNDTWYYYIHENRWLQKTEFVNADYPDNCKDELEVAESDDDCIELTYPPDLLRSEQATKAIGNQDILPFREQPGYTPDRDHSLYFGIVDDADAFVDDLRDRYLNNEVLDDDGDRIWIESTVPVGTPIAPAAATGPRQYAKLRQIQYNDTTTLDVWEWCISGRGEPTRGKTLDGQQGRSNDSVMIQQPKRQASGWDGCRELQWKYPHSRADLPSVFIGEPHHSLVFYGGVGYEEEPQAPRLDITHETLVLDDLWSFSVFDCPQNCSNNGICANGFCQCDPGFYGLDCSNVTCPGTVCHYDENNVQHCTYCCHDGYVHTDADEYISGVRKLPCHVKDDGYDGIYFTGQSEGICDGFGTCQCAPPFLGDDCSIKDCKHNCSFNGHCSLEYPVSRCICRDGYFGEHCQNIACLNNCSYPNGVCDWNTGRCTCGFIADPLDPTRMWNRWHGEDCSYLPVWSGARRGRVTVVSVAATAFVLIASMLACFGL